MKNHPVDEYADFVGMHSADPADRIEDVEWSLLRNVMCDETGRIIRSHGIRVVTTAAALGVEATDGRTAIRSLHVYEGKVGENPDSRALCVVGSGLRRSRANDLWNTWDEIDFPTDIDTPGLDRAAAGVFRNEYFYHQNGLDYPFRIKCEEDDPTDTLTTTAEALGLKPPARCMYQSGSTAGDGRRFPANAAVSYCITFVYGTRGESGPGPVLTYLVGTPTATVDQLIFTKIPVGGTGVTARRIYRSKIGLGKIPSVAGGTGVAGASILVDWIEKGPTGEMFLVAEIPDNTTVTWTDKFDNNSLDVSSRVPQPRPFPPISQYQLMHLDRIFWAKCREHPWTVGVLYESVRSDIAPTNYAISISNTGAGTITFKKDVGAGLTTDFTIPSYKTLSLRTIMEYMLMGGSGGAAAMGTSISDKETTKGVCPIPQGQLDLDRTYTFKEVTDQSIFSTAYWLTAIDDPATTQGPRWFPNRFMWSDITFPEQVSWLNSADLTRHGSKRITNMLLMDNVLVIETDTDSWLISGTFIPDNFDVPSFEVHRSQASHGSICTRPDATVSVPNLGTLMVAHDALRNFRGESSDLAGLQVRNWFDRILAEPVTRDFLVMFYHGGEIFIALSTYETR